MIRIEDRLPEFSQNLKSNLDDGMRELARDILIESQNRAPFKRGQLRTDSDIKKLATAVYQVRYHKEYARFQEFGGDGNRIVRNYTTPGTGKGYLGDTGDRLFSKAIHTLKKHAGRTR